MKESFQKPTPEIPEASTEIENIELAKTLIQKLEKYADKGRKITISNEDLIQHFAPAKLTNLEIFLNKYFEILPQLNGLLWLRKKGGTRKPSYGFRPPTRRTYLERKKKAESLSPYNENLE